VAISDAEAFRECLGHFPTGVTVVTSRTSDGPVGFVVGSFFSVSLDPLLVGFAAGRNSYTWSAIKRTGSFCVNVLGTHQLELSARMSGPGDRFEGISHGDAPVSGAPLLDGVPAWVDCTIDAIHPAGDHDLVVGRVEAFDVAGDNLEPLIFHRRLFGGFVQVQGGSDGEAGGAASGAAADDRAAS
jgi:3-hydroxy-9,10-secoandrosta-1,3,5(10)-triene-9,17-dione monooxygenase reductase component